MRVIELCCMQKWYRDKRPDQHVSAELYYEL